MLYGDEVQDTRKYFFISWQKHQRKEPLHPLEQQLVQVIQEHPEYHSLFEGQLTSKRYEIDQGEINPFLHLGLHLALRDQLSTNNPPGITALYQQLCAHTFDPLAAEHLIMTCLENYLHHRDETQYLAECQALTNTTS